MEPYFQPNDSQQRVNVSGNTINLTNSTVQIQTIVGASTCNSGALVTGEVRWQQWYRSMPLPPDAVRAGWDSDGDEIFVGQSFHEGNLLPAKAIPNARCALISYDGEEFQTNSFSVLCSKNATWVPAQDGRIPPNAIPGGHTSAGEVLYIGRAPFCRSLTPGKVIPSKRKLYIPYGHCEVATKRFEILVLK